jgi:hypothetical protein
MLKNLKLNKMPEEQRISKEEKEELKSLRDYD